MDLEFHYYIGALTASAAGFSHEDAIKIASSAQYVDENRRRFIVVPDIGMDEGSSIYTSCITQSYLFNIKPISASDVYIPYHFIPGKIKISSHAMKGSGPGNGQSGDASPFHRDNYLATTPMSRCVKLALRDAISSGDVYRIGIASHAYADSWAHQNFTGIREAFNITNPFLKQISSYISLKHEPLGHLDALHKPDKIGYEWHDKRLRRSLVNNNARFLAAARALYCEYSGNDLGRDNLAWRNRINSILKDESKSSRINKCNESMLYYSGKVIPPWQPGNWQKECITRVPDGFIDTSLVNFKYANLLSARNLLKIMTNFDGFKANLAVWKNDRYRRMHWYMFQEAAKKHKKLVWKFISRGKGWKRDARRLGYKETQRSTDPLFL